MGKVSPRWGRTDWLPGACIATLVVTAGWGVLVYTGSIDTIWPMLGIANQLLAVLALALVTTLLINSGKGRYAWTTLLPLAWLQNSALTGVPPVEAMELLISRMNRTKSNAEFLMSVKE